KQDCARIGAGAKEGHHAEIQIPAISAEHVPRLSKHDVEEDGSQRAENEQLRAEYSVGNQAGDDGEPEGRSQPPVPAALPARFQKEDGKQPYPLDSTARGPAQPFLPEDEDDGEHDVENEIDVIERKERGEGYLDEPHHETGKQGIADA